ncbi:MAG TPA: T9SS type A sorting domain-containing protein, partial [Flavisolibacter sp.]|nr:T9SS type A sorting domain-containing protein [Flavisolibacter sp.]
KSYTIPTSASSQSVYLYWPLISSTLANGTYTYLRIRITTAAMTTANATGYFPNGETEDYRVPVNNYVLATQLLSFNAMKNGKAVDLQWKTSGDQLGTKYEVERSTNMMDWSSLNVTNGTGTGSNYAYTDGSPLNGTSYYRLRTQNPDGSFSYSKISTIIFNDVLSFTLSPNPASNSVKMSINGDDKRQGSVKVLDIMGRPVYAETVTIEAGLKTFMLPVDRLSNGIYSVQLQVGNKQYIEKLVIKK